MGMSFRRGERKTWFGREDKRQWHPWYAWHPVFVHNDKIVWRRLVWRRAIEKDGDRYMYEEMDEWNSKEGSSARLALTR